MVYSEAQRGYFGAELRRRRKGKKARMKGMSTAHIEKALKEAAGKSLPARSSGGKGGTGLYS